MILPRGSPAISGILLGRICRGVDKLKAYSVRIGILRAESPFRTGSFNFLEDM